MKDSNSTRIAWLVPTAWFYWQPFLNEFTKLFPETKVFTGRWPGFARGFENSLSVQLVGRQRVIAMTKAKEGYGSNFTYLSPSIVIHLFKFRPHLIFTSSFGIWTILALGFKFLGRWKVVIAYEGSGPTVDYRNSIPRLTLRRAMVQLADACISNSEAGKDYLVKILRSSPKKTFAHPYEVPDAKSLLDNMEETSLNFSQWKRPIFLFAGSLIPRKGLSQLLQACVQLKQQKLNNYTLLIIGDGAQREELENYANQHELHECVQWLGRVEYSCLGDYFRNADVFILPTLEDTWGLVVLEAMIFGKPVLCSTGAGTAELIEDGENGYHFDPRNCQQLVELMAKLIKTPETIISMGKKSQQRITQYNPKAAAVFLDNLTQFVLN